MLCLFVRFCCPCAWLHKVFKRNSNNLNIFSSPLMSSLSVEQEEPVSQFFFDLGQKKQHHWHQQNQGAGRKRQSEGDRSSQPKQPRKPRESNSVFVLFPVTGHIVQQ